MLAEPQLEYLLSELCAELGFCLPPDEEDKLRADIPSNIDMFTDAVFKAEGMDPFANRQLRRQVRERVAKYFNHVHAA